MATSFNSQQGDGKFRLQFETDSKERYKLVEKAAQMAVDGEYTADVAEVKHGEWIKAREGYPRYVCTRCHHLYNNMGYKYCPNCGAKMDGQALKEREKK